MFNCLKQCFPTKLTRQISLSLEMRIRSMLTIPKKTDQLNEYCTKGEPSPKKPHQSCSKIKVMLTVFFNYCGVVHYKFFPLGQTVNDE